MFLNYLQKGPVKPNDAKVPRYTKYLAHWVSLLINDIKLLNCKNRDYYIKSFNVSHKI